MALIMQIYVIIYLAKNLVILPRLEGALKKVLKVAIPIGVVLLVLIGITILKKTMANKYIISSNEPYQVGSEYGNIYNNGLYGEEDGRVYFANPYDGGALYSMNADQSDMKKIASGNVSNINVLNGYVYYFSSTSGDKAGLGFVRNGRGLYRTDVNGKDTFAMAKCTTDGMLLVGDYLYFLDFAEGSNDSAYVTLQKVSINNEDQQLVLDEHINIGGYANGQLYYGGVSSEHKLHTYDVNTGATKQIYDVNVYMPVVSSGYVYYLDLDNDYHLTSMSLSDGSRLDLSGERVDTFNIYGGVLYYQNCNPNEYALKRINADGTNLEIVKKGVYKNINVTSTYTYFQEFANDLPVYYTPTTGTVNIQSFDAARDAAISQK